VDIDRIAVHGSGRSLTISTVGGPFAPGFTPEPTGESEIELAVDGFARVYLDDQGASTLTAGSKGLSWNDDDDVDITVSGASTVGFVDPAGDDVVSAQGGYGTGRPLPATTTFQLLPGLASSSGNDTVTGHAGPDLIDVE